MQACLHGPKAGLAPLLVTSARNSGQWEWQRSGTSGASSQVLSCCQVTQHGACLGLGLAALGSADEEVTEEVKNVLYTDSAVAGEAAGIALGLVTVGTASEKAQELLTYAHDTQHEKVWCSCAMERHACPAAVPPVQIT